MAFFSHDLCSVETSGWNFQYGRCPQDFVGLNIGLGIIDTSLIGIKGDQKFCIHPQPPTIPQLA